MQDISQYTVRQQAAMILGGGDEVQVELRAKHPQLKQVRQRFFDHHHLDALERSVATLAQSYDVWLGAAPRSGSGSGTADDVPYTAVVWTDCDTPESVAKLRAFVPRATLEVETSRGRMQGWWALDRWLPRDEVKPALARLCAAVGGDRTAVDVARVMRAVGTTNHKRGVPEPVVTRWFSGEVHDIDTLLAACPEAERAQGEFRAPVVPVPHGERHYYLKDFGERLVRAGVTDREAIEAHLWFEFYRACEQTDEEPRTIAGLAKWWAKSKIAQRENAMAELMAKLPDDSFLKRVAA